MMLGTPRKYINNRKEAPWNFTLISCPLFFQNFLQLPIQLRIKCFVVLELCLYFFILLEEAWESHYYGPLLPQEICLHVQEWAML